MLFNGGSPTSYLVSIFWSRYECSIYDDMLSPAWHCIAWIWLGELPTFPTSLNLPTNLSWNYLVFILSLDSHSPFTRLDSLAFLPSTLQFSLAFLLSLSSIFFLFNLIGGFLACSLYLASRYSCLSSLLPFFSLFNSYSFYQIFNKACSRHSTLFFPSLPLLH